MSEFEGTPGPWRHDVDVIGTGFYIQTVDMSHTNTFIGDVGGGMQPIRVIEANARLIAAAPELLEALQRLILAAKPHCVPTSILNMRVNEALAIIEQTIGGQDA